MNFFNINSKYNLVRYTLISLAFIMTFGNFFPIDGKNITDSYSFEHHEWIDSDPILKEITNRPKKIGEEFALSSHWGDQIAYLKMANHEKTIPPYQFRVLYPLLISFAMDIERKIMGWHEDDTPLNKYRLAQLNFWFFNFIFLILSALILYKILKKFTHDPVVIISILMLYLSQYAILKTASYAMLDVFSYFIFIVVLYCLISKRLILTGIFLILSVLTKELFIIWAPALLAMAFEAKDRKYLYLAAIPIIPFVAIRTYYGFGALNVQYNWDVSNGEIKLNYLIGHLGNIKGIITQAIGMIFAFGVLWLYIGKVNVLKEYNLKYLFLSLLVLSLIAEIMLSSRIVRVLAPIFPLFSLIPVIYFKKQNQDNV